MKFGGKQSMADKMKVATKKGYDSGKPSTGSSGPTKWKANPTASKGAVGITFKKKV